VDDTEGRGSSPSTGSENGTEHTKRSSEYKRTNGAGVAELKMLFIHYYFQFSCTVISINVSC